MKNTYFFTLGGMFFVVADFAVSLFFIPRLGEFTKCCLVESITAESVVVTGTIEFTTETRCTVDVVAGGFNSDSQT